MNSPITAAAILCKANGRIFSGKHHDECYDAAMQSSCHGWQIAGFVDGDGKFLTRKEAYARAVECKQVRDDGLEGMLISEMLWPEAAEMPKPA